MVVVLVLEKEGMVVVMVVIFVFGERRNAGSGSSDPVVGKRRDGGRAGGGLGVGERSLRNLEQARGECQDRERWKLFCRGHPLVGAPRSRRQNE